MADSIRDLPLQNTQIMQTAAEAFRAEAAPLSDWNNYLVAGAIAGTTIAVGGAGYFLLKGKGGALVETATERLLGKSAGKVVSEGAEALGINRVTEPASALATETEIGAATVSREAPAATASLGTNAEAAAEARLLAVAKPTSVSASDALAAPPVMAARAETLAAPAIITRSKTADEIMQKLMADRPAFAIPQVHPNAPEFMKGNDVFAKSMASVFNQNQDKLVRIEVMGRNGYGTISSGFLLPGGKHVGTAIHVTDGADGLVRPILGRFGWSKSDIPLFPDLKLTRELAERRQKLDFSVLELGERPPELKSIRPFVLRPANEPLKAGEQVFGIGFPNDHGGMVVSPGFALGQKMMRLPAETGQEFLLDEAHIFLNRGNSGGTLYDKLGRIAGMTVQRMRTTGELPLERGYSVPMHNIFETFDK